MATDAILAAIDGPRESEIAQCIEFGRTTVVSRIGNCGMAAAAVCQHRIAA
jgi:hypothetical protein